MSRCPLGKQVCWNEYECPRKKKNPSHRCNSLCAINSACIDELIKNSVRRPLLKTFNCEKFAPPPKAIKVENGSEQKKTPLYIDDYCNTVDTSLVEKVVIISKGGETNKCPRCGYMCNFDNPPCSPCYQDADDPVCFSKVNTCCPFFPTNNKNWTINKRQCSPNCRRNSTTQESQTDVSLPVQARIQVDATFTMEEAATSRASHVPASPRASYVPASPRASQVPANLRASQVPDNLRASQDPASLRASYVPSSPRASQDPASLRASYVPSSPRASQVPASPPVSKAPISPPVSEALVNSPANEARVSLPVSEALVSPPVSEALVSPPVNEARLLSLPFSESVADRSSFQQ